MSRSALGSDRAFLRFGVADGVSLAGTMVTKVVLPILVYRRTGAALETSLLVALETTPYLAFGLVAGRVDRRRLMYACELISALLVGSVPAANAIGLLTVAHIYVVAVATAATFVWRDAANFGVLPALCSGGVGAVASDKMQNGIRLVIRRSWEGQLQLRVRLETGRLDPIGMTG